jgi:hypothetical protein
MDSFHCIRSQLLGVRTHGPIDKLDSLLSFILGTTSKFPPPSQPQFCDVYIDVADVVFIGKAI